MTHRTRRPTIAGPIALVLALAAGATGLAGCGSANGSGSGSAGERAGDKVSVDTDKGEVSVQTDQGTVTAGKALPDGFPKDAVPLIQATVVTGTKGAPGSQYAWSVVMQTPRAIDDVAAEVRKDFTAAGYRTRQANVMGDVTILQFADSHYQVGVTITRTGGTVTVTYVVRNP